MHGPRHLQSVQGETGRVFSAIFRCKGKDMTNVPSEAVAERDRAAVA